MTLSYCMSAFAWDSFERPTTSVTRMLVIVLRQDKPPAVKASRTYHFIPFVWRVVALFMLAFSEYTINSRACCTRAAFLIGYRWCSMSSSSCQIESILKQHRKKGDDWPLAWNAALPTKNGALLRPSIYFWDANSMVNDGEQHFAKMETSVFTWRPDFVTKY